MHRCSANVEIRYLFGGPFSPWTIWVRMFMSMSTSLTSAFQVSLSCFFFQTILYPDTYDCQTLDHFSEMNILQQIPTMFTSKMEKNRTHYFDYKLFNLVAHKVFEHEHAHKVFDRMPQRDN